MKAAAAVDRLTALHRDLLAVRTSAESARLLLNLHESATYARNPKDPASYSFLESREIDSQQRTAHAVTVHVLAGRDMTKDPNEVAPDIAVRVQIVEDCQIESSYAVTSAWTPVRRGTCNPSWIGDSGAQIDLDVYDINQAQINFAAISVTRQDRDFIARHRLVASAQMKVCDIVNCITATNTSVNWHLEMESVSDYLLRHESKESSAFQGNRTCPSLSLLLGFSERSHRPMNEIAGSDTCVPCKSSTNTDFYRMAGSASDDKRHVTSTTKSSDHLPKQKTMPAPYEEAFVKILRDGLVIRIKESQVRQTDILLPTLPDNRTSSRLAVADSSIHPRLIPTERTAAFDEGRRSGEAVRASHRTEPQQQQQALQEQQQQRMPPARLLRDQHDLSHLPAETWPMPVTCRSLFAPTGGDLNLDMDAAARDTFDVDMRAPTIHQHVSGWGLSQRAARRHSRSAAGAEALIPPQPQPWSAGPATRYEIMRDLYFDSDPSAGRGTSSSGSPPEPLRDAASYLQHVSEKLGLGLGGGGSWSLPTRSEVNWGFEENDCGQPASEGGNLNADAVAAAARRRPKDLTAEHPSRRVTVRAPYYRSRGSSREEILRQLENDGDPSGHWQDSESMAAAVQGHGGLMEQGAHWQQTQDQTRTALMTYNGSILPALSVRAQY